MYGGEVCLLNQHKSSLPGFLTGAPLGQFVGVQKGSALNSEAFSFQDCKFLLTSLLQRVTRANSSAYQFPVMQIGEDTSLGNHLYK